MAIWAIPNDYVIEYATNGDDIASFSQKVKYLLEEAFNSLNTLHNSVDGEGKSLIICNGDSILGNYNGSATTRIDLQSLLNQTATSAQDVTHLFTATARYL